jgi:hypothetical protein
MICFLTQQVEQIVKHDMNKMWIFLVSQMTHQTACDTWHDHVVNRLFTHRSHQTVCHPEHEQATYHFFSHAAQAARTTWREHAVYFCFAHMIMGQDVAFDLNAMCVIVLLT